MEEGNVSIRDYYLLPRIDLEVATVRLREENGVFLDAYRFDTLDYLVLMATPVNGRRAA